MKVEVIRSDIICDYCKNKYDYNFTGKICPYWYTLEKCGDMKDFEGKELLEVCENDDN